MCDEILKLAPGDANMLKYREQFQKNADLQKGIKKVADKPTTEKPAAPPPTTPATDKPATKTAPVKPVKKN